jgi:heat shock protein HslJ
MLGLAGCQSSGASTGGATGGAVKNLVDAVTGSWTLSSLEGNSVANMLHDGMKAPWVSFSPSGNISGFAGVNRISGTTDAASLAQGKLDLSQLVSTKMAGTEQAMKLETMFLDALQQSTSFSFDDKGALMLGSADRNLLTFTRATTR